MKTFNNLKISTKIIVNIITSVVLMCIIGVVGYIGMTKLDTSAENMYYKNLKGVSEINKIDKNLSDVYIDLQLMMYILIYSL